MDWILEHWLELSTAITAVVTGASIIAKLTPTEVDDNIIGKVIILMDKLALNNKPTVKK